MCIFKQQPVNSYKQDIHSRILKFINRQVYIARDPCHELFCVVEDFYVSGMQGTEVTKALQL